MPSSKTWGCERGGDWRSLNGRGMMSVMPMPSPLPETPRPSQPIEDFLRERCAAGSWPGAVYAIGSPGQGVRWAGAVGRRCVEPEPAPAREDALYDLASLTKGLVTTALALRLATGGLVDLEQDQTARLPEFAESGRRAPSLRQLLTHTAGLPAWAPLYRLAEDPAGVPGAMAALSPREPPAAGAPVYSCLGPILAGLILERASGRSLRELFDREIRERLGIPRGVLLFAPVEGALGERVAPTERGRRREAEMAGSGANAAVVPGPDEVVSGQVHDGNAFFLGGAAGNAGLFGTARAVFRLAGALAFDEEYLPAAARALLFAPLAGQPGGDVRSLGFQHSTAADSPGAVFGPRGFGHAGFTGTSVWVRENPALVAVLLTNRVHPLWREAPMQAWRARFHEMACRLADGGGA